MAGNRRAGASSLLHMRTMLSVVVLCVALPALAEDTCEVKAGPHDVVKQKGDLVIEAGQVVEDAIAVDGRVTVKTGAQVKSAVSLHGDVVVEAGATVTKTAFALGGQVREAKGSHVADVLDISDAGVRLRGESGTSFSLNLVIDGKSLGQRLVEEAVAKTKKCQVTQTP
jgi:hypothetical protein